MEKQWYVIQLIAGSETTVKAEILKRIEERNMQNLFGEILIPQAKTINFFSSEQEKMEQLFPGYMIVSLVPMPETFRLISTVPRVYRFLGGENPLALTKDEVDSILEKVTGKVVLENKEKVFFTGTEVEITAGPFSGFSGIIQSVDDTKQRLIVTVSIFGRSTPVEILFDQVKL